MTDDAEAVGDGTELTPREQIFIQAFGNSESPTFNKATASARRAGYSTPRSAGWRLRRRPHIKKRLEELAKEAALGLEQVMSSLERLQRLAEEKGDLATAARCAELLAKRLGAFVERYRLDGPQLVELTEFQIVEAQRLTRLLLIEGAGDAAGLPAPVLEKGATEDADLRLASE